jgi:7-carboxy-7-deazaguanine synthase
VFRIVERFVSIQGEGLHVGRAMAFVRFAGCVVGKAVCTHCDTDFTHVNGWNGGGEKVSADSIVEWAYPQRRLCLTGGEPLAVPEISDLMFLARDSGLGIHVETSGTVWSKEFISNIDWLTVSPKPGYLPEVIDAASELKVIIGGLGQPGSEGWPTLEDALRWAASGKPVFIQPRNLTKEVNRVALQQALDIVYRYPQLRLSVQLHKLIGAQ